MRTLCLLDGLLFVRCALRLQFRTAVGTELDAACGILGEHDRRSPGESSTSTEEYCASAMLRKFVPMIDGVVVYVDGGVLQASMRRTSGTTSSELFRIPDRTPSPEIRYRNEGRVSYPIPLSL